MISNKLSLPKGRMRAHMVHTRCIHNRRTVRYTHYITFIKCTTHIRRDRTDV